MMSSTTAQTQFAAEFVTLMVAAAGVALALLRPEGTDLRGRVTFAPASRALATLAFLTAGTTAFLSGSLLVTTDPSGAMGLARLASAVLLAASLPGWSGGPRSRNLLVAGAVGWAVAGVAELAQASVPVVEGVLAAGSVSTGVALLSSSRRSIAARVAAAAASTLLLVVLVVAVALSQVISSSLEHTELQHLGQEAQAYSSELVADLDVASNDAALVAADLQGSFSHLTSDPLIELGSGAQPGSSTAASMVQERLAALSGFSPGSLFYESPAGILVPGPGSARTIPSSVAAALAADPQLIASSPCTGKSAFVTASSAVWATAGFPVCTTTPPITPVGRQYSALAMTGDYLRGLRPNPGISLSLLSRQSVLATTTPFPATRSTLGGLIDSAGRTEQVGSRFVSVIALPSNPVVAVAVSTPASSVLSTRTQLYRTLFLIALGGTILALGFAAFVGDRITAGVRRLTAVAARIQSGKTSERSEISGDDEVSVLGSAFDSMLDSLESQNTALQAAADDETRLRNRLEAVVGGMSDALVAVDARGKVTDFNRAAEELFGISAASALGEPVDSVVDIVDENGSSLGRRLAKPSPSPWGRMGLARHDDAGQVPVAVSAGPLRGPLGEMIGSVLVVRDLRREREVEQMKTEFLSRVGHELRTPLTGIMGYADILLRRDVSPERAHLWHEEILQAARRLLRIVEMLEFFASSGAGRVLLRPEPLDTKALVRGITSSWAERLPENVRIGRHVDPKTPPVFADRRWLSLAIEELIDNAIKFSPGGGRVVVAAAPSDAASNGKRKGVEISVVDRGIGMTASENASLFGDFVQADGSDTRRFGGLGLGLAVVQRVVEGHGGSVGCRSTPGRGTTFTIYLPGSEPARRRR